MMNDGGGMHMKATHYDDGGCLLLVTEGLYRLEKNGSF